MECTIRNRWTGNVMTGGEYDDLRACLVAKVQEGANLRGANLRGANLRGADLYGADDVRRVLVGPRPFLQMGPTGSRGDWISLWITNEGPRLQTGCFDGTIDEFLAMVQKTHGDNVYAKEYRAFVELARLHAEAYPRDAEDDRIAGEKAAKDTADKKPAEGGPAPQAE